MKNEEAIALLSQPQFLDKLHAYACRRTESSYEAEDLCSEMVLAILKALRQTEDIQSFHAFAWTIAHRVYADYCEKRKRETARTMTMEDIRPETIACLTKQADAVLAGDSIEDLMEKKFEKEQYRQRLRKVFREISFLSLLYRRVMIMHYLEERKITDIARILGITETAVKQRLYWARRTIRENMCIDTEAILKIHEKGVKKMKSSNQISNPTLQPISLFFFGSGNPVGNDPREKAERILSQNLVYLCRNREKNAAELARELDVPMPYIEQELEIQCRGANGQYGLLQKTARGNYIANIIIAEEEEFIAANEIYKRHVDAFCKCLADNLETNREKIRSLGRQCEVKDFRLPLWPIISRVVRYFTCETGTALKTFFPDVTPANRPFTVGAVAGLVNLFVYGCNGIGVRQVGGYSEVYVETLSDGKRLQPHFGCSHNIAADPLLLLTLRCVGGLALALLSEEEKETAARAIQCGYLQKDGDILKPAIVVLPDKSDADKEFWDLLQNLQKGITDPALRLAEDLSRFIKEHIPPHLMGDYPHYNSLLASNGFSYEVMEKCISLGILNTPEKPLGPEGVLMILTR